MSTCTCCVCLSHFEGEEPPILMMDREGEPLVLCPDCAALMDAIAGTPDSPKRDEAIAALREIDVKNPAVATELAHLIDRTDAPLSDENAYEDEDEVAEQETPAPTVVRPASELWLYLGVGFGAAALLLLLFLRFML